MPDFTQRTWKDAPAGYREGDPTPPDATPLDAAGLNDVELRVNQAVATLRAAIEAVGGTVTVDTRDPVPADGQDGDAWVNSASGEWWPRKVNGSWGEPVQLKPSVTGTGDVPARVSEGYVRSSVGVPNDEEGAAFDVGLNQANREFYSAHQEGAFGPPFMKGAPLNASLPVISDGSTAGDAQFSTAEPGQWCIRFTSAGVTWARRVADDTGGGTGGGPLQTPANVTAAYDQPSGGITVSWSFTTDQTTGSPPDPRVAQFDVRRRVVGNTTWTDQYVDRVSGRDTYSVTVAPVTEGNSYEVQVLPVDGNGATNTTAPATRTVAIPATVVPGVVSSQVVITPGGAAANTLQFSNNPAGAARTPQAGDVELVALQYSNPAPPPTSVDTVQSMVVGTIDVAAMRTPFEDSAGLTWTVQQPVTTTAFSPFEAYLDSLERGSTRVRVIELPRRTSQQRRMFLVAVGPNVKTLTVAQIAATNPRLHVFNQHGDEQACAEAALKSMREQAAGSATEIVLYIPDANPDGRAAGTRNSAAGKDINRTHIDLSSPEAENVAYVYREFGVKFVADHHQYYDLANTEDILLTSSGSQHQNTNANVAALTESAASLTGAVATGIQTDGWTVGRYPLGRDQDPRLIEHAAQLQGIPAMLCEVTRQNANRSNVQRMNVHVSAVNAIGAWYATNKATCVSTYTSARTAASTAGANSTGPYYFTGTANVATPPKSYTLTSAQWTTAQTALNGLGVETIANADGTRTVRMDQGAFPFIGIILDARSSSGTGATAIGLPIVSATSSTTMPSGAGVAPGTILSNAAYVRTPVWERVANYATRATGGTYVQLYKRQLGHAEAAATSWQILAASSGKHTAPQVLLPKGGVNYDAITTAWTTWFADITTGSVNSGRTTTTFDKGSLLVFGFADTGSTNTVGSTPGIYTLSGTGVSELKENQSGITTGDRASVVGLAQNLPASQQTPAVGVTMNAPAVATATPNTDSFGALTLVVAPATVTPQDPGGGTGGTGGGGGTGSGTRDTANITWDWNRTLSTSTLMVYNGQEAGTSAVMSSEQVRWPGSGRQSMKITTSPTGSNFSRRHQRTASIGSNHGTYGDIRFYGMSIFLHTQDNFDGDQLGNGAGNHLDLWTFRWSSVNSGASVGDTPGSGPNLGGRILNNVRGFHVYFIPAAAGQRNQIPNPYEIIGGPLTKGVWIDWVQEIKWNNLNSSGTDIVHDTGYRRVWRNGTLISDHVGDTVQYPGGKWTPRIGIYQGSAINHSRILYYDEWRIGRTYDAVDPSIAPGA
jgi:hypothetical protein